MSEATVVQVAEIVDSRWQTRQDGYSGPEFDELVESVRQHGIVEPPGVFINDAGDYELVYGHRRMAAGLTTVPVTIKGDLAPEGRPHSEVENQLARFQQMVIADNLHHEDLKPLELARALQDLIEQQGLSQGAVAELYGKSQQWVSDKIRLLDLAPEVQEQLTTRSVEESVARKLAQLPQAYQGAVAKHIEGRPSREAVGIIQEIEKAADPHFWDLPEDKPWSPERINVKAMMDDCLEKVPQEKRGEVLVKLSKSWLLYPPATFSSYSMDRFAQACGQRKQSLKDWQVANGRECEKCVFAGEGLFARCGEEETKTCEHCLITIDPVRLARPDPQGKCNVCDLIEPWCTDLTCYIETQKKRVAKIAESEEEGNLEVEIAAQDELRAFYDRQLQPDVQCEHWLAQGCGKCAHWRGPGQKDQCGAEEPEYIEVGFWQSGEVIVPRCTAFVLRDPKLIPEMDQSYFHEILLAWLEAAKHKFGQLIPGEGSEEKMAWLREGHLNKKQLAALLTYAANPELGPWCKEAEMISPITGEKSIWKLVEESQETTESEPAQMEEVPS